MTDISAEAYLAGCLLIDGENVLRAIRGIVTAEAFEMEAYRAIFTAATTLLEAGETIDPVSITTQANRQGVELPRELLVQLMEVVPTAANCVEYAHRVAEGARTRRIKELATRIQEDSISSPDELLTTLQRECEVIRGSDYQRGLLTPNDTLRRFMDHVVQAEQGRDNFIPSGFPKLDKLLGGGFIRGGMYILGARPAVGKSTFAINLADNIRGNVLFVSLEMTPEQIMAKRVSRLTSVSAGRMLSGQVNEQAWEKIGIAASQLYQNGVYMNNRYDMTVQQIHILAQSVPELRAVVIDYLGLIQPATRSGSTYETVSQISRDVKRMAISLNVPVVCLSQLSRQIESRKDKRPMLSDLRDSGAIEQDADAVMFLYREDYYTGGTEDGFPSPVELSVAKNRHGKTGDDNFNLWLSCSLFREAEG